MALTYLTVKEFAELFRRAPRTIYRWIDQDYVKPIKVKDGYLIPSSEVERLARKPEGR